MNPVPKRTSETTVVELAASAPSAAVLEASPEDSEPPHAATLNATPTRSVTVEPSCLNPFVPTVGGFMPLVPPNDTGADLFSGDRLRRSGRAGKWGDSIAKFDQYGAFLTSWGEYGTEIGQFNTLHSIQTDAEGNVYVGDRGNSRIQVFDNDGNFKYVIDGIGAPWAIYITPGPHQYLYSSNSAGTGNLDNGEIYKMELDGTILGRFGRAGRMIGEFASTHAMDCRNENELYVGEILSWRVQKITLHP